MSEKVTVGNVKTCPACGAEVGSMAAFCPECGHEFNSVAANKSVQRLSEQLAAIMNKRIDASDVEEKYRAGYIENEKINLMCNCIQQFPIPTSKEDLLEFILYAVPQATSKGSYGGSTMEDALRRAWKAKAKEAILKGRIVLKMDPNSMAIIEEYDKQLSKFHLSSYAKTMILSAVAVAILFTLLSFVG